MKYDGDGRATARFFSGKGCRRAPLFTAPADAARQERGLSPFSDERPSSRFRGIFSPSKRRRLRYSTVGLTRYRTR
ncbi:hypothetical protein RRG06_21240 [Escherichia coli]|nr:hypothetical protein [Escherichia coli]MDT8567838.1 hypothetical protein [Escherichia coli]MEA0046115.1 hypothetical protein [Escherichia coli]MEA0089231.1 hypothetical protein [Escherichia coli]